MSGKKGALPAALLWLILFLIAAAFFAIRSNESGREAVREEPHFRFTYISRYVLGVRELARWAGTGTDTASTRKFLSLLEKSAVGPADSVALVVITNEIAGRDGARARLRALRSGPVLPVDRTADLEVLDTLYQGRSPAPGAVAAFGRRYGWFGGLVASGDARDRALASARRVVFVVLVSLFAFCAAFLAGLAALIAIVVLFRKGRLAWAPRFDPPGHETAFLECAALTLAVSWVVTVLALRPIPYLLWFAYPILFVPLFWPLLRGVSAGGFRGAIGLTRGRGLLREFAAGLAGYLAAFPAIVAGLFLTGLAIRGRTDPPIHPIIEVLVKSGPGGLALHILLGVAVAPLFEEILFRGILQHHLRRRWGLLLSGAAVSILFALLHPQGLLAVPILALTGFVFSLIREWRGSLAASFAAHAANNGILILLALMIFR